VLPARPVAIRNARRRTGSSCSHCGAPLTLEESTDQLRPAGVGWSGFPCVSARLPTVRHARSRVVKGTFGAPSAVTRASRSVMGGHPRSRSRPLRVPPGATRGQSSAKRYSTRSDSS
jgi:hypothetical protein